MEITLQEIRKKLITDTPAFIAECEKNYWDQVRRVADYVTKYHQKRPIILLSGPSGSGKTTTAHLLEFLLEQNGLQAQTVSMDNYFYSLTGRQREDPTLDLESPDRLDKYLLAQQLKDFFDGKTVEIPTFDFVNNTRVFQGNTLSRGEGNILILEGIHALNPDVITLSPDTTVRLYVSVRTRLICADNTRLHPKWIRLMRRMLRDEVHRARPIADTHKMFESVGRGEMNFIMPYKIHSMFDIDTLIPYEIALYRDPLLQKLIPLQEETGIASMIRALEEIPSLTADAVPENSLLNEFI